MANDMYPEAYRPRQLDLQRQFAYYSAMMNFWASVAEKFPHGDNKTKATLYTREYERVLRELEAE